LGVYRDKKVVSVFVVFRAALQLSYDDKNGANAAARFWWMLRAIGHEKVQVLNGGLQQAENMGFQ
jgi:3-mercaptopyruvate sulfurtransferase SseA